MTNIINRRCKNKIRAIQIFPKEGIIFRDITTGIKDAKPCKI